MMFTELLGIGDRTKGQDPFEHETHIYQYVLVLLNTSYSTANF